MKLSLKDLWYLVENYHLENNINGFEESIELAKNELSEILNPTKDYPPFIYYLILEHLDGSGINFMLSSEIDKEKYFNETIEELNKLL